MRLISSSTSSDHFCLRFNLTLRLPHVSPAHNNPQSTVTSFILSVPQEVTALRDAHTVRCAPWWNGGQAATTSTSLSLVSCGNMHVHVPGLHVAGDRRPCLSKHLAMVLSVGTVRRFKLLDGGHAALPKMSFWPPRSHLTSVRSNGRRNRSDTRVRDGCAPQWNKSQHPRIPHP